MNKVQYEQENNIRYMKMEFCNITEEAEYEIKMLMNNKISIFLPVVWTVEKQCDIMFSTE